MIREGLIKLFEHKKASRIGLAIYVLYFFLYQWSIGYFTISLHNNLMQWLPLSNWTPLVFKRVSLFLYEGIGILELFGIIRWIIAPMNIVFGLILADLVFINIACVVYMMNLPKQCRLDTNFNGFLGILPSFLTGFACCAPSFLIPLASLLGGATAMISQVLQWLFPISVLILLYGAYTGLKKITIAP